MARHNEPLSGGLANGEDPALLRPGQLAVTQNAVYSPGSQAIQRARGRTAFGTVTAGANIDGMRDVQFDNGDHYLIAMASGLYRYGYIDPGTGAFVTLTAITEGNQLEAIQYRNRFFLLNGVTADASSTGTNYVMYLTATSVGLAPTMRQHGMLPVPAAPATAASSVAFSQTVSGYYEYWTTEVAKLTQDGAILTLESAFNSNTGPTTVYVSSTGMAPVIYMPTTVNPITTHWRIYRSPPKSKFSDKEFPAGFMIAEAAISSAGTNQVVDSSVVLTAASFPTTFNTSAFAFDFLNPSGAFATGGGSATGFASATAGFLTPKSQAWYGFNSFGGFAGSVRGITVEVGATVSGATASAGIPLTVTIGKRNPSSGFFLTGPKPLSPNVASKSANVTATGGIQAVTYGASGDRWFASDQVGLADSDFDANFMVKLTFAKFAATPAMYVDYIKASAHYAGTVDSTVQYPAVVYTFGDIVSEVSKNFPPPNASTGDVFEDTLVLNDVSNPSLIRWSFPGDPEVFPPTYYLDFETRENDQVRLIKVVNSILVVMLDSSTWAINYLPSERDSSFDRGKAVRAITRTYGCVDPMCACVFSMDDSPEILAFVSDSGIHGTDGRSFTTYTNDLDWRTIISATSTSNPIALINDREHQELLFYYRNDALGNETYMCLHLNYAPEHVTNGRLKISGPVHMRNFDAAGGGYASLESAWSVQRTTGATDVLLGYGGASAAAGAGAVYREGGTVIPAQDSTMKYVTRRMYLNGLGNEWEGQEVYGYAGSYNGSPVITYTAMNTKTNDAGPFQAYQETITLGGQKLHKVSPRFMFEGAQITAQITASAFAQHSLTIEGEPFGPEDSGR